MEGIFHFSPHDQTRRRAGADWAYDQQLRATYRQHRPMVERSIAWLVGPKGRCRKLRYRGTTANDQWLHTRMAASTSAACSTSDSPTSTAPGR